MSEVYNPESSAWEQIESLELEARRIKQKLDAADGQEERQVLGKQLKEIEHQVENIRKRLRS